MKKESDLGKDPATKLDEFLEKCQRGGGPFSMFVHTLSTRFGQDFEAEVWSAFCC